MDRFWMNASTALTHRTVR